MARSAKAAIGSSHPVLKAFAALCAASIIVFFLATFYFYRVAVETQTHARAGQVDQIGHEFETTILGMTSPTFVVAGLPSLRRFLDGNGATDRTEVAKVFMLLASSNPSIDQIRFIDTVGMERIRIDRIDGQGVSVPTARLQDKSKTSYFAQARNLLPGRFYLSRLDLNVENGAIEVPWKPVFRVATPVFRSTGEWRGIVVVNFNATELLKIVSAAASPAGGTTELIDDEGYWLAGAPADRLWGFMFGARETYATQNRDVWTAIRAIRKGQFRLGNRLYTHATISPLELLMRANEGSAVSFVGPVGSWRILDTLDISYLGFLRTKLPTPQIYWFGLLCAAISFVISAIFGRIVEDRRRLRRQNAREVRRMNDFLAKTRAPIYIRDAAGRFSFVNRQFADIVGRTPDSLIGRSPEEILAPEAVAALARIEAGVGGADEGEGSTVEIATPDRTWLVNSFHLVDDEGTPDAICTIGVDVTELKQVEERLREAKETAEVATAAKANFLAAMSHEIRTPMNGVIGMVDLLGETKIDDDQRKMVGTIKASANALIGIIGDILDFSKLEAGRMEIERRHVVLADIFESVGTTLWAGVDQRHLMMPMYCDPRIPNQIFGDEVRLRQILNNLIGNAIKFTSSTPEKRGKVIVRADLVATEGERVRIRLSVADNGIGMDEAAKARLFRPFEQGEASTVRRFGGTGLGLSICKQLVELMDGEISVESAPGKGSTFAVEAWFDAVVPAQPVTSDLSGLRALLVINALSTEASGFLVDYITYWKGEADVFTNLAGGAEALKAALTANGPYDVLVFGTAMPLDQKIEIRDAILADPAFHHLRFVMMSFHHQRTISLLDGSTVLITAAPISRANFVTAIAVACGRASPETQSIVSDQKLPARVAQTIAEAEASGHLILVAEDNETNRDVLRRQIALLGYAAVIVDDGKQALEAYRSGRFSLLLTDCHMPVMDGYQLTEAIRAEEKDTDRHLPIVAITANALYGEAERCLEIGMDDFIVKPVELRAFRAKLLRWLPLPRLDDAANVADAKDDAPAADLEANASILNLNELRRLVGDDPEMILAILSDFLAPSQRTVAEIGAAYAAREAAPVGFAAHKLKSSARAIGATILADMCAALEEAAKSDAWSTIDDIAPRLARALADVAVRIEAESKEQENA